jgi:hypothetical protein
MYLIDDQFTQQVLFDAGWSLVPSDAVYRAHNPYLIADVYVKNVYWVQGHPIFHNDAELVALDSPNLVANFDTPLHYATLGSAYEAADDVLRFSKFMLAAGRESVVRSNLDAIEDYLTKKIGLRWGIPTYRYDAQKGLQRENDLVNPLEGIHNYEAYSPNAGHVVTVTPTWDRYDVVNLQEPTEPPTEQQIFNHDLNKALTLATAEERAHTMLHLYNRCVAAEQWAYVNELKPWIEREGYNVIDGLGDGDLARLAKREA